MKKKIIIGISGATGIQYGIKALELLRQMDIETHLIVSKSAELVRSYETDISHNQLVSMADVTYAPQDMGAIISSGSFKTIGMLIAPCSVKSMAEIASGTTEGLLTRAADVVLKERRRLVLLLRETPLHLGHLKNMMTVTESGGIIMPPVPSFYTKPKTIDDIVTNTVARALDLFGLDVNIPRWTNEHNAQTNI